MAWYELSFSTCTAANPFDCPFALFSWNFISRTSWTPTWAAAVMISWSVVHYLLNKFQKKGQMQKLNVAKSILWNQYTCQHHNVMFSSEIHKTHSDQSAGFCTHGSTESTHFHLLRSLSTGLYHVIDFVIVVRSKSNKFHDCIPTILSWCSIQF